MIDLKYRKADNYPHNRKTALFDRNAFQSLSKESLREVNKGYNTFCPNIFVIECIAPNNTDNKDATSFEKQKNALREKLLLIENPIVITGSTNVVRYIRDLSGGEYNDILNAWQIARNCIVDNPLIMKRVSPRFLYQKGS